MAATKMKKVPYRAPSKRVQVEQKDWHTESTGVSNYFVSGSHTINLDKTSSDSVIAKRGYEDEEINLMGAITSGEKKTVVLMHIRRKTSKFPHASAAGAQINLVEGGTYKAAGGLVIKVEEIGPKSVTFDLSMSK